MFMSIMPMAGPMPRRTPTGMASTIFSRMLRTDSARKMTPSIRMMMRPAWKDSV